MAETEALAVATFPIDSSPPHGHHVLAEIDLKLLIFMNHSNESDAFTLWHFYPKGSSAHAFAVLAMTNFPDEDLAIIEERPIRDGLRYTIINDVMRQYDSATNLLVGPTPPVVPEFDDLGQNWAFQEYVNNLNVNHANLQPWELDFNWHLRPVNSFMAFRAFCGPAIFNRPQTMRSAYVSRFWIVSPHRPQFELIAQAFNYLRDTHGMQTNLRFFVFFVATRLFRLPVPSLYIMMCGWNFWIRDARNLWPPNFSHCPTCPSVTGQEVANFARMLRLSPTVPGAEPMAANTNILAV
ncbi:Mating-type protein MAT alpha 1 HMG-box-containing protein [Penicillium ucsense]|uniref:Mating-type protein MAT alpha 1 HMG-box-containing protein n=1 Tax=Penicillium ucsense TaxID=2839758 RepID=A0A8J8WK32_9EURO|nr:Mating-type protein MAT alpha 1 HMG-box-containing protein [Penicillium ucsense]KAF7738837.1 Mating-type protein MAT alpha 1 HMG-box-containing protein [Penicillium ucsense]